MSIFGGDRPDRVVDLPINQINVNPYQPRKEFDKEKLQELSESIAEIGLLQPIVVRRVKGKYELIAGERRLRAAKLAGLERISALVKAFSDHEIARAALIENIQREDLNPLEEAQAYDTLLKSFNMTQSELARQIGKSQSTVANKMRLLKLPDDVKSLISGGMLTERHGRALLTFSDDESRSEFAQKIVDESWNVRQTHEQIDAILEVAAVEAPVNKRRPIIIKDVRIFINAITSAFKAMKDAGVKAEMVQQEEEKYREYIIRIPK